MTLLPIEAIAGIRGAFRRCRLFCGAGARSLCASAFAGGHTALDLTQSFFVKKAMLFVKIPSCFSTGRAV